MQVGEIHHQQSGVSPGPLGLRGGWVEPAHLPESNACPSPGSGGGAVSLNQDFLSGSGLLRVTNLARFEPQLQELFSLGFANPLLPGGDRKLHISFHLEISTALRPPLFPCERHICVSTPRNFPV